MKSIEPREVGDLLRVWPIRTAQQAVVKILPMLYRVLNSKMELESQRFFLKSVRDNLDEFCRRYRRDEGLAVEEYQAYYQPLFDALSLLNDSLLCRPIYRVTLQKAFDDLSDLQRLLERPCA